MDDSRETLSSGYNRTDAFGHRDHCSIQSARIQARLDPSTERKRRREILLLTKTLFVIDTC